MLGANAALSPVVTFMTLQFTLMARECFDALQNWSDEHSYVKVILAGRSSGEITDEEAAQKVLAEYFEKNPDHLPTSNEAGETLKQARSSAGGRWRRERMTTRKLFLGLLRA